MGYFSSIFLSWTGADVRRAKIELTPEGSKKVDSVYGLSSATISLGEFGSALEEVELMGAIERQTDALYEIWRGMSHKTVQMHFHTEDSEQFFYLDFAPDSLHLRVCKTFDLGGLNQEDSDFDDLLKARYLSTWGSYSFEDHPLTAKDGKLAFEGILSPTKLSDEIFEILSLMSQCDGGRVSEWKELLQVMERLKSSRAETPVAEPAKTSLALVPAWAQKLEITPQGFAEIQQETRNLLNSSKLQYDHSMKWLADLAKEDKRFYARLREERKGLGRSKTTSHEKMRAELLKSRHTRQTDRKSSEDCIPRKKPAPILSLRENVKLISKKRK